ncbi:Mrx4p Ecym_2376 [Eremothecium cymbalariae DBVPG|uniref:Uncharacterized protein n=1 Tax=Eremothecium cymbalariae (strain CBS 270.75 / DBVPG 7215 / KCTC 17166 / NRRL Y-17582) TaxID=931890 RepID=G8JNP1_ERECY|nr:Hypothetical protein Ecym_2376 [Eremothecium cymbalariae DBVPG\
MRVNHRIFIKRMLETGNLTTCTYKCTTHFSKEALAMRTMLQKGMLCRSSATLLNRKVIDNVRLSSACTLIRSRTDKIKDSIEEIILEGKPPNQANTDYKVLFKVFEMAGISKNISFRQQAIQLKRLIANNKITDSQLYHAVQVIETQETDKNYSAGCQHSFDKTPSSEASETGIQHNSSGESLGCALSPSNINSNNNKQENKPLCLPLTYANAKGFQPITNNEKKDPDLIILEELLRPDSTENIMVKKFNWDKQGVKKFDWENHGRNQVETSSSELHSAGSMSLLEEYLKNLKSKPSFSDVDDRMLGKSAIPESKELLVYNFQEKDTELISLDTRGLLNVNYKDLFSVINGGTYPPEQMLNIVNKYEDEGWELVGDIYDDPHTLVFQRKMDNTSTQKNIRLLKKKFFSRTTALTNSIARIGKIFFIKS